MSVRINQASAMMRTGESFDIFGQRLLLNKIKINLHIESEDRLRSVAIDSVQIEDQLMHKNVKRVLKGLGWLVFAGCLGFVCLIGFYIYMIYGIHPSDEGTGGLACEYDRNDHVTKAEMYRIQDGKRVITPVDPLLCQKQRADFPK